MARLSEGAYRALALMLEGALLIHFDEQKGYRLVTGFRIDGQRIHSRVAWGLVARGYVFELDQDTYELTAKGQRAHREEQLQRS